MHVRACMRVRTKKLFFFKKSYNIFFFAVLAHDCTYTCDCTCARTRARTHVHARIQKKLNFFFLKKFFFKIFFFDGPRSGLLTVTQMPFYGKYNDYSPQTMYFRLLGRPLLGRLLLGRLLLGRLLLGRQKF